MPISILFIGWIIISITCQSRLVQGFQLHSKTISIHNNGWQVLQKVKHQQHRSQRWRQRISISQLRNTNDGNSNDGEKKIVAAPSINDPQTMIIGDNSNNRKNQEEGDNNTDQGAATKTVNKRLLAEIQTELEKLDEPKTKIGQKISDTFGGGVYNTYETEEERNAALAEAKDLNGVNPLITLGGSVFSFTASVVLWLCVGYITELFSLRPIESDVYTVQRLAGIFRTIVIGTFSLLSGFCGVNGLGLFLLSVRVAYGVYVTGELDPTPIVSQRIRNKYNVDEKGAVNLPNIWNLMLGKQEGKKRR